MGSQIINGPRLIDTPRSQVMLTGGGIKSCTVDGIRWSDRFLIISLSKSVRWARDGLFEIQMPPDGTVIPSHSGAPDITVTNGRIPMTGAYCALWYIPPIGRGQASVPGNFRFTRYLNGGVWDVPEHWVHIASRNDDGQAALFKWGDGSTTDYWRPLTLVNGWANYGEEWAPAMYRRGVGDLVEVRGLVRGGTASLIGTLPTGFRPSSTHLTTQGSADVYGRVDIKANGQIVQVVGTSTWTTINATFHAEQ